MTAAGINVTDLSFGYDSSPILSGLSMRVQPGEIVALLGPSGCGKSTLLRCIAGLLSPQSGQVEFSDSSGEEATVSKRSRDLSYVFQDPTLMPWRTVWQNVHLPFELGKRLSVHKQPDSDTATPLDAVRSALEAVGLDHQQQGKYPPELSGGMRMRTSIARALVTDPSVLLLDEPFAALDDLLRTRLNDLVLDLWKRRQRTIVFVTHNIAEAAYLSHRVAILASGKIAAELNNPLEWPRQSKLRTSTRFAKFYGEVSSALADAAGGGASTIHGDD